MLYFVSLLFYYNGKIFFYFVQIMIIIVKLMPQFKIKKYIFFEDLDTDDESISGSELKKRIKELLRIKGSVQKELMSLEKRR